MRIKRQTPKRSCTLCYCQPASRAVLHDDTLESFRPIHLLVSAVCPSLSCKTSPSRPSLLALAVPNYPSSQITSPPPLLGTGYPGYPFSQITPPYRYWLPLAILQVFSHHPWLSLLVPCDPSNQLQLAVASLPKSRIVPVNIGAIIVAITASNLTCEDNIIRLSFHEAPPAHFFRSR